MWGAGCTVPGNETRTSSLSTPDSHRVPLESRGEIIPEFVNPFSGRVPDRKLTRDELVRALRLDLAAEHEAVHAYTAHAAAADDPLARAVLLDIADEERVHAGEFARLIAILTKDEDRFLAKGTAEVDAMAKRVSGEAPVPPKDTSTIGSMREGGG